MINSHDDDNYSSHCVQRLQAHVQNLQLPLNCYRFWPEKSAKKSIELNLKRENKRRIQGDLFASEWKFHQTGRKGEADLDHHWQTQNASLWMALGCRSCGRRSSCAEKLLCLPQHRQEFSL